MGETRGAPGHRVARTRAAPAADPRAAAHGDVRGENRRRDAA
ncbi:hypothetical protein Maq22A_1p38365 (plasmid) [Methylobacterium aquaticum]|uniref:Uncharacterized protein n=1 Tax=Methylobacterium aquaticum TaxID=270351 RepID=A0A1Y0ZCD7_9HYPH|nr:hypothetical protein Maq22A_1p38365 [Methylobacterium aquaticum]